MFFLFFVLCLSSLIFFFFNTWPFRHRKCSATKKRKKNIRKRLGKGILNTYAKFQGLTLKNAVDIWAFVRLSAKITASHSHFLVLVYIRIWALNLTQYWPYAAMSSNVQNFAQTCLGAPRSGWSRTKEIGDCFFFQVNAYQGINI